MIISTLQLRARAAARKAGFTAAGAVFLVIGFGFLTAAGWIVVAEFTGVLFATFVIGCLYAGIGLILVAVGMRRTVRVPVRDAPALSAATSPRTYTTIALVEAFLVGLSAGVANRSSGRKS